MELNGKRVLVVGLGKSGVASALFMKNHGARVTVSDTKSGDELRNEIPVLLDNGITVETGGHGDRIPRCLDNARAYFARVLRNRQIAVNQHPAVTPTGAGRRWL